MRTACLNRAQDLALSISSQCHNLDLEIQAAIEERREVYKSQIEAEKALDAAKREMIEVKQDLTHAENDLARARENLARTEDDLARAKEDLARTKDALARARREPTRSITEGLKAQIHRLIQLCHPDRHAGSPASHHATQWLLSIKETLK